MLELRIGCNLPLLSNVKLDARMLDARITITKHNVRCNYQSNVMLDARITINKH